MKNKQRKLSLALSLAIGFSAFTPTPAMASTRSMPAKATALKAVVLPSVGKEIDENTVKNITFAEFIRYIIIEIDGEKPIIHL